MFDKTLIPKENTPLKQFLTNIYANTPASAEYKKVIEKRLNKINQTLQEKIINVVTISKYLDQQWQQANIKPEDQNLVIKKLEALQQKKKKEIQKGFQQVAKSAGNLDAINSNFKMTAFEEFQLQEKVKEIKKKKHLEIENPLVADLAENKEILHAINRPFYSVQHATNRSYIHYTGGLFEADDNEEVKKQKAEDFVKKIKDEKREFVKKIKRQEKSLENRENALIENMLQKQQQEDELKQQEKKQKLKEHIKELKIRGEVRAAESAKWEEVYKAHLAKKPLFKQMENKYKKGFVIPELEERKKKLKELRDFHKPLNINEILEHERKVTKMYEEQQAKKKNEDNTWNYKKPEFESAHHKVFAEEMARARNAKEEEAMEKLRRKEKVMELLQTVKEKHAPTIDPQKELERMEIIEKLRAKNQKDNRYKSLNDTDRDEEDTKKAKMIGDNYLKEIKELVKSKSALRTPNGLATIGRRMEQEGGSVDGRKRDTTVSIQSEPIGKKRDYLSELRKENKIMDRSLRVEQLLKKKDLDENQRQELLQGEVSKMEEKVKRKELVRRFKKPKNLEEVMEDEEFDKLYVDTIKAKLEILSHL